MEGHIFPVEVTNVSDYIEGLYEVMAFFMKDGEVVWAEKKHTEKTMSPGDSATVTYGIYDQVPAYDGILIDVQR